MSKEPIETGWKASDGLTIFARIWVPERETYGVICLVHGLGEHSGRYHHVSAHMNSAGYAVLAPDLRGHGRSGGKRGHAPSMEKIHEDLETFVQVAKERFPGKPVFLYGHSLGSILVLSYTLSRRPDLAGVVVTGLGLRTALHQQKMKIALAKILGRFFPAMTIHSGLDPKTICSEPTVVYEYVFDPLIHYRMSFGMGILMLREIDRIFDQAAEFHLPLLIMHGKCDQLGFPEGSEEFAGLVTCDCTVKIWENMAHEVHNEPGNDRVFEFTIAWLDSKARFPASHLDKA